MPDGPDTEGRREPNEDQRVKEREKNEAQGNPDGVPAADRGHKPKR